jgi:hypothetical protein
MPEEILVHVSSHVLVFETTGEVFLCSAKAAMDV